MEIRTKEVVTKVIDKLNITSAEWDSRPLGSLGNWDTYGWREHMAKLLNQRAEKLFGKHNAVDFYCQFARFAKEIGFGEHDMIVTVTERLHMIKLEFSEAA